MARRGNEKLENVEIFQVIVQTSLQNPISMESSIPSLLLLVKV